MKTANWKDIAELIGIAAIVASLVFVGMEMRQTQRIAIAAQYHERAALAVEWFHTQYEYGDLSSWGRRCYPILPPEMTLDEAGRDCLTAASFLTISDNHLYQYESGFLDEDSWLARRATIKRAFRGPVSRYLVIDGRLDYRKAFVDLARKLVDEIEAEDSE